MGLFIAQSKGVEPQSFSNPYDALTALMDMTGECEMYLEDGDTKTLLLSRNATGNWVAA